MQYNIAEFIAQLKETNFSLADYVDFQKVSDNVDALSIKLNQLNYLIGQNDMDAAVRRLWNENPNAFSVLPILIAVREKDNKRAIGKDGKVKLIAHYYKSPDDVIYFLNSTGLTNVLKKQANKEFSRLCIWRRGGA